MRCFLPPSRATLASLVALTSLVGALSLDATPARAQTATCIDATGEACLNVIRAARADGVVDDIFTTSDGLFAPQLHFATYLRGVNGCIGNTHTPTILSGYTCHAATPGEDIGMYANSLDWYWTQVVRTDDSGTGVADGTGGFYYPWRGRLMDLGGEANRVVLFPITDHAPLPCEAFEYTVWLSNNPDATEMAPESAPDASKWNPARLIRAFTQGWTRNATASGAGEAGRGDLATHLRDNSGGEAVADALATVWALPCGITFRYIAIQGGNNGNPGPECVYDSSEDELDAVAGLNEDNTAICIDADGDGHRAASCGGDDCDDTDASVHPGAFEPCGATRDLDCRPMETCPTGTICSTATGLCQTACFEGGCASGFACASDSTCVEAACLSVACAAGTLCRAGACVAPCEGAVCPAGRVCSGGACLDPCLGVVCPTNQVCLAGTPGATTLCGPSCNCTELAAPLCPTGRACDARTGTPTAGLCVDPGCESATCAASETCTAGACVDACAGVTCPVGQWCTGGECVPDRCASVRCTGSDVCRDGVCFSACDGVTCPAEQLCRDGVCVPDPCSGVVCGDGERCLAGTCVPSSPTDDGGPTVRPDAGIPTHIAPKDTGACGCRVASTNGGTAWRLFAALLGLLALGLRRRR